MVTLARTALTLPQPGIQRDHARYLLAIHGEGGAAVAADLQGARMSDCRGGPLLTRTPRISGAATAGIPREEWLGARRGRRAVAFVHYQDAPQLPLHR